MRARFVWDLVHICMETLVIEVNVCLEQKCERIGIFHLGRQTGEETPVWTFKTKGERLFLRAGTVRNPWQAFILKCSAELNGSSLVRVEHHVSSRWSALLLHELHYSCPFADVLVPTAAAVLHTQTEPSEPADPVKAEMVRKHH